VIEFGHFGGDAFQVFPANINIGVYPDTGHAKSCGNFTANVVSGAITSYTINNGGNCYASYSGSTELTVGIPARVPGRNVSPAVSVDAHRNDSDH